MFKPEITISGGNNATSGILRTAYELPGGIYRGVVKSVSLVETRAKTHHLAGVTLKPRSHFLQRSVKSDVKQNETQVTGRVGSPVVYAAIHEFGGIIRPKKAKYLVFQINGQWVRTTHVNMPKREWLLKSFQDVQTQIEAKFGRQVQIVVG